MQINDIYQQKINPIVRPVQRAKTASSYGPIDSVLTPLINAVSDAITPVKTLGELSLSSNHPMLFSRIFP
jgi:hypothetical protein